jgi:hypothetical protein
VSGPFRFSFARRTSDCRSGTLPVTPDPTVSLPPVRIALPSSSITRRLLDGASSERNEKPTVPYPRPAGADGGHRHRIWLPIRVTHDVRFRTAPRVAAGKASAMFVSGSDSFHRYADRVIGSELDGPTDSAIASSPVISRRSRTSEAPTFFRNSALWVLRKGLTTSTGSSWIG